VENSAPIGMECNGHKKSKPFWSAENINSMSFEDFEKVQKATLLAMTG
jgi:hypothetical protein